MLQLSLLSALNNTTSKMNVSILPNSDGEDDGGDESLIVFRKIFIYPLIFLSVIGNVLILISKIRRLILKAFNFSDSVMMQLSIFDITRSILFAFLFLNSPSEPSLTYCMAIQKTLLALFFLTSSLTIFLAYLRYRIVCFPLSKQFSIKRNMLPLICIWVSHFILFAHKKLFSFSVIRYKHSMYCQATERDVTSAIFITEVTLFIAVMLMSFLTMTVFIALTRKKLKENFFEPSSNNFKATRNRNRSAVNILQSMYIAYVTSFIPWIVLYIISSVNAQAFNEFVNGNGASILLLWFIAGSFCNSFLTLTIYSKNFRAEVKSLLRGFPSRGSFSKTSSKNNMDIRPGQASLDGNADQALSSQRLDTSTKI